MRTSGSREHHVVVGGGFGGLQAVPKLRRGPVEVTLVDRRNFHLFRPLTYSPVDAYRPLATALRRTPSSSTGGVLLEPRPGGKAMTHTGDVGTEIAPEAAGSPRLDDLLHGTCSLARALTGAEQAALQVDLDGDGLAPAIERSASPRTP